MQSQRPVLQDFLQRLLSGHSTHGVADIASCSLSTDPRLAASQSVGATPISSTQQSKAQSIPNIPKQSIQRFQRSQKVSHISHEVHSMKSMVFESFTPLHLPVAPCSAWTFANGGVSKYIDSGARHWPATGSSQQCTGQLSATVEI